MLRGVGVIVENPCLMDFAPIFLTVIKEKAMNPAKVELVILDEESEEESIFERAGVLEVLYQLKEYINAMTIYTGRSEFFAEFVESTYEETGLLTVIRPKKEQKRAIVGQNKDRNTIILDFEWRGMCYNFGGSANCAYIPVHKKPWEIRENLDIIVPFGYNTVIVKGKYTNDKKFIRDRFDEGFYRDE